MKGLRLSEIYPSIQGEGPNVGVPTIFTRFSGCNMRCPGWPCDTPFAIYPEQWKNDPVYEAGDLMNKVAQLPGKNVCITGGEPTMQPAEPLESFADLLLTFGYTIDVFTNGSLKPLPNWMLDPHVTVIMDWKLEGSGEAERGLEIRKENTYKLMKKDAIKFVVASNDDFEEALTLWKEFTGASDAQCYVGVAWGLYSEADLIKRVMAADLPWKVNVQVHKFIWPNVERGI